MNTEPGQKIRLDKWLWAARFFKTRSLAKEAIEGGHVRYNQQRVKPGRSVEAGATLVVKRGWEEKEVVIKQLSDKRKSAKEAVLLYEETESSVQLREKAQWMRKQHQAAQLPPAHRPTKKQRRQIHRFRQEHDS